MTVRLHKRPVSRFGQILFHLSADCFFSLRMLLKEPFLYRSLLFSQVRVFTGRSAGGGTPLTIFGILPELPGDYTQPLLNRGIFFIRRQNTFADPLPVCRVICKQVVHSFPNSGFHLRMLLVQPVFRLSGQLPCYFAHVNAFPQTPESTIISSFGIGTVIKGNKPFFQFLCTCLCQLFTENRFLKIIPTY